MGMRGADVGLCVWACASPESDGLGLVLSENGDEGRELAGVIGGVDWRGGLPVCFLEIGRIWGGFCLKMGMRGRMSGCGWRALPRNRTDLGWFLSENEDGDKLKPSPSHAQIKPGTPPCTHPVHSLSGSSARGSTEVSA